ncbi:MAG: ADYC domain-containing protein [Byssovorax sp.]
MNTDSRSRRQTPLLLALLGASLLASAGCAERAGAEVGPGTVLSAVTEDGAPVTLRVDAVEVDSADAEGDVVLYTVSSLDPADGAYKPYCLPDAHGKRYAIPLSGSWDASRRHLASAGVITFACASGTLAKCVRQGYKPWKTVNGASLADYHQACVHMMSADYCGDGGAHTREGTAIDVWDRQGLQWRGTAPEMVLEAAWSPEGAVYVSKARYGQTLESLVSECPDRLRGHTALDTPGLDEAAIRARFPRALLFNASPVRTDLP